MCASWRLSKMCMMRRSSSRSTVKIGPPRGRSTGICFISDVICSALNKSTHLVFDTTKGVQGFLAAWNTPSGGGWAGCFGLIGKALLG